MITTATLIPWTDTLSLTQLNAAFLASYIPSTRTSYAPVLRMWVCWCEERGVDPIHAQRPHVDLWARWLDEVRNLAPATRMHYLCIIRAFYVYLVDEEIISTSPAKKVRLPKVSTESQTRNTTRQELSRFLAVSERNPTYHAMCCLLALNGLRISEICNANIEDLGVEGGHRTLKVTRKGGKKQTIPLAPKTARTVEAQIGERTSGPVLLTKNGTRMTRTNAAKAVDRLGKEAGIETKMHPHRLRHAFATVALSTGVPIQDVQDAMGHSDPRVTVRYNRSRFSLDRNPTHVVSAFISGY